MQKKRLVLSPGRIIALGFLGVILLGSGLLMLPCSRREGVTLSYIDALFTATSAVCVTGLVVMDSAAAFTPLGRTILAVLIQIGGLGVTTVGAGVILAMGKKINLKGRHLIQEAGNLETVRGTVRFVKQVLYTTLTIELLGAGLSFPVFVRDHPPLKALGYSLFHSIAAFNNSGFDILGQSGLLYSNSSLAAYHDNVLLNLTTAALIILGGIGFLVVQELGRKGLRWKKYSMHTKVVLSVTAFLVVTGTVLLKLTEGGESWLGTFFHSVSARTAGFSTTGMADFSQAGQLTMIVLMFIGASPGSTGGGIKTTTFFVLFRGILSSATNKQEKAFKYSIPAELFRKSAVIALLALTLVICCTWLMLVLEPEVAFLDALFETTSAFGTVGLSTGITPTLGSGSRLMIIVLMYIGRLGPLTVASLWYFKRGERAAYPEGNIAVG